VIAMQVSRRQLLVHFVEAQVGGKKIRDRFVPKWIERGSALDIESRNPEAREYVEHNFAGEREPKVSRCIREEPFELVQYEEQLFEHGLSAALFRLGGFALGRLSKGL
jgi:hypothetical protein